MSFTCIHQDPDDVAPCGKSAKEEYGNRYCGIHKATFYKALAEEHLNAKTLIAAELEWARQKHGLELERMKGYTSKQSKISTALLWVGSLSAAAFAGALATYLIMM